MHVRRVQRLAAIWLLLSALLAVFLFATSQSILEKAIAEHVNQHLLRTLDESLFGNTQNRGNDQEGLHRVGQQMNADLHDVVADRWYSPHQQCVVRLDRVDDVLISDQPAGRSFSLVLLRNQIEREVVIALSCSRNWWVVLGVSGLLGLLFVAIGYLLPPPLSKAHRQWINYLLERGYSGVQAFDLIRGYDASSLGLGSAQWACLELLHDSEQQNFAQVLKMVLDPRVAALDDAAVDWLVLGLCREPGNLEAALDLAHARDVVDINLADMTLTIRGLSVPISRTPLFYYAWYAKSRLEGDGWITNPASNRPDRAAGGELVQLMSRFDGHAKAINDLEQAGLKARTLDQNRSKIKDDIVAVLGEKLSQTYLFEASRHPDGLHMRYRLAVEVQNLRLVL